MKTKRRKF